MAACAAMDRSAIESARESWRGATYDEVVAAWGRPARSAKDSHTWFTEDRVAQAQRSGGGVGGMVFGSPSGAPNDAAARCERTLAFRDGRVLDASWTGNAEFCKRFARPRR